MLNCKLNFISWNVYLTIVEIQLSKCEPWEEKCQVLNVNCETFKVSKFDCNIYWWNVNKTVNTENNFCI